MSTDLHDRLSDAYPHTDISAPAAERLWEQGRRQRRHRTAGLAAAGMALVAAVGFGGASLVPSPAGPPPLLSQSSESAEQETAEQTPEAQPVPEPANEGDLAVPDDAARFDLSIFLCDGVACPEITSDQQQRLQADLEAEPAVAEVFFESKEQAVERFQALFEDQPELAESVDVDALPASLRVKLHDPGQVGAITEQFASYPGVEEVVDQAGCPAGSCEGFVPEPADPS